MPCARVMSWIRGGSKVLPLMIDQTCFAFGACMMMRECGSFLLCAETSNLFVSDQYFGRGICMACVDWIDRLGWALRTGWGVCNGS